MNSRNSCIPQFHGLRLVYPSFVTGVVGFPERFRGTNRKYLYSPVAHPVVTKAVVRLPFGPAQVVISNVSDRVTPIHICTQGEDNLCRRLVPLDR